MAADALHPQVEDVAQALLGGDHALVGGIAHFPGRGIVPGHDADLGPPVIRVPPGRVVEADRARGLRRLDHRVLQVPPHVEEAEALHPHEPLEGGAGGHVDAHGTHVDGHGAGGLHDVGVDVGAAGVGQLAQGGHVGQQAVDVGNQGDRDQARVGVDGRGHGVHVDAPVAVAHDPHLQAVGLPHLVVAEACGEGEVVGDHVAAGQVIGHAVEQVALGLHGAAGEGDLARVGVDQPREELAGLVAGRRPVRPPGIAHVVGDPVDVAVQGRGGVDADGVGGGVVEVGGGARPGEVGAHALEVGSGHGMDLR